MSDAMSSFGPAEACLIDGVWSDGQADARIEVIDPATEDTVASFQEASVDQARAAVDAARRAFDSGPWRDFTGEDRSRVLHQLADRLEARADEYADLVVAEIGSPVRLAKALHVGASIECLRFFADAAARGPRGGWEEALPLHEVPIMSASLLRREAAGVVSAITAYNYPLLLLARKVGGALAAGCTEVVIPSPRAPISTMALLRELDEIDIPPGVLNLVVGGIDVAKELTTNPAVDVVSFTGSLGVGREVMSQAATGVKKVVLELGGKSPNIVLPGTDFSEAVGPSSLRFMLNTGQGCGATTRTFVPAADYGDWVEASREFFGTVKVGDPRDPATDVGPLVGSAHRERVQGYVDRAVANGAVVEANSPAPTDRGFFIDPMLVGSVGNADEISQEELFGPVGVVIPFDDVDQALELAHQTRFGLNANIWGPVPEAIQLARKLRTGTVTINGGGGMRQDVPWGGMGASGVGREAGEEGFNEYLEVKHIQWPLGGTTKPFGAE